MVKEHKRPRRKSLNEKKADDLFVDELGLTRKLKKSSAKTLHHSECPGRCGRPIDYYSGLLTCDEHFKMLSDKLKDDYRAASRKYQARRDSAEKDWFRRTAYMEFYVVNKRIRRFFTEGRHKK